MKQRVFFWFDIIQWLGRCQLLLYIYIEYFVIIWFIWLVGLTILKNISQWEGLSHILWTKNMFQSTNQIHIYIYIYLYYISFWGKFTFFLDAMNFRHEELKPCSNMEGLPWIGTGMQCICYWNPYVLAGWRRGRMGSHNGLICTNPKLGM
jgi:hypothetical protein